MSSLTLRDLRRRTKQIETTLSGLIAWSTFTLEAFTAAVEGRMSGTIHLLPFHWEGATHFGMTIGYAADDGPHWLVIYESETDADHQLVIILHELMHMIFGHCLAILPFGAVRPLLVSRGILPGTDEEAVAAANSAVVARSNTLEQPEDQERQVELAATWVITQARRAGSLPPSGRAFSHAQRTLDAHLRQGAEDAR